jgi:hypothetical protein
MTLARILLPTLLSTLSLALLAAPTPVHAQAQAPAAQEPPCMKEFTALRDETGKRAAAIRTASERKASPQEACGLFKSMVAAEAKFVKFAADNGPWCGIPPQIIKQLQDNHKQTLNVRTQVCKVAAQGPARPAGPSLSEALGAPTTSSSNVKTGHGGTFDTLTGTPLGGGR